MHLSDLVIMPGSRDTSRASSKPSSRQNSKPPSISSQEGIKRTTTNSSSPTSSAIEVVVNGDAAPTAALAGPTPTAPAPAATTTHATLSPEQAPKPLEREGTWNRLHRMFTNPTKDQSKPRAINTNTPIVTTASGAVSPSSTGSTSPGASSPGKRSPEPPQLPEKPAKITIEKTATTTSLASSVGKPPSRASTVKDKDVPRFTPASASTTGLHEHHLKSSRRQEKLSHKFKALLGGRKHDATEHDDLSLISDWVDATLKREQDEAAAVASGVVDKKGGPNDTKSLVEKYGKCQEVIGRGAFGIVRISHKKQENGERLFAVKEFRRRPEETEKRYSKRLMAEYNIGISLMHPNICRTLDLVRDDKGDLCEVMEFCAGGDLYSLILSAGRLEAAEADCFFKQMMRGVQYLHEMGVAHRDLKPENLLLTTRGSLKITDFGNGECFRYAWETEAHMVTGVCGSAPYIAPEEYTEKEFDGRAVDVWACGVIYMAMRTGRHLWNVAKKEEDEFYKSYLEGRKCDDGYSPIESLHRARCRNVIYSVLDPSATRRLTAAQVLKSEWVREIKLCRAGEEGL
jgi:protein-serine/threonine kinase